MPFGPIDVQRTGSTGGSAARADVRRRGADGFDLPSDFAAFAIVRARDFAAREALRGRRAAAAVTGFACSARFVNPNFCRADLGSAMRATTSSLSAGLRRPRYVNRRCKTLPPGGDLRFAR